MSRADNWDTEEAFDMLNCEERLYNRAMLAEDAQALRLVFVDAYPEGKVVDNAAPVNEKVVDWGAVYAWLHNTSVQ